MEERTELVKKICAETPQEELTPKYLELLGDYIIEAASREERKQRKFLTNNRQVTINKRETSYEGLVSKFENGEDGLYNLMIEDKNVIFTPKVSITPKDIAEIPGMRELRETISSVEARCAHATGKDKYILKKQLIDLRRDQYVLKNAYNQPMATVPTQQHAPFRIELNETRWIDENGEPQSDSLVSLFNPDHISALFSYYDALKISTNKKLNNDFYYLVDEFEHLLARTLTTYPLYYDLVQAKMAGKTNLEVQALIESKYGIKHSVEYISSLYRNKIPKMLAEQAKEDYLIWYYTQHPEKTAWKKCSCCGQEKIAHHRFFSKNNTSKDGWYSICKVCRNQKAANGNIKGE